MNEINLMKSQIVEVFKKYDGQGTSSWTYDIAAQDLQYQVGSLIKCILQLRGFRYREGLSEEKIKEKISDELADILAEVLFISHELNIDVETAWNKMVESDEKKIEERSK